MLVFSSLLGKLIFHFVISATATCCFAVLFNAPGRVLLSAGVAGGLGWATFVWLRYSIFLSSINANLVAAVVIALAAEIFARREKKPVTMYVVPALLVLVPGYSIFRAMNMFLNDHVPEGLAILLRAVTEASAIAVGIVIVGIGAKVVKGRLR